MIKLLIEISRPFTLLFPFIAAFAGAALASGRVDAATIRLGAFAGLVFIVIHSATNIFNQYYDRDIDAINKPSRPIPRGAISPGAALAVSIAGYTVGCAMAALVNHEFLAITMAYSFLTIIYSAPPRLKRSPWLSNATIALARGLLIIPAGYAAVKHTSPQIWALSSVLCFYLLGAASTKDFAEVKGDEKFGIRTLPVIYGAQKTIKIISPFFIIPFLLIPVYCHFSLLSQNMLPLTLFVVPGALTVRSMLNNPAEKAFTENSRCWALMYFTLILFPIAAVLLEVFL